MTQPLITGMLTSEMTRSIWRPSSAAKCLAILGADRVEAGVWSLRILTHRQ